MSIFLEGGSAYLNAATAVGRARGVEVGVEHDFQTLVQINQEHRNTWYPLPTMFDPAYCDQRNSFFLAARAIDSGEIVAVQANRPYDWRGTVFAAEAQSLRLFYDRPDRDAGAREAVGVSLPAQAVTLTGIAWLAGSQWIRPDFRGRDLPRLMVAMSRVLSVKRGADFCFGISVIGGRDTGKCYDYGFNHEMPGVHLLASPLGSREMALVWSSRAEIQASIQAQRYPWVQCAQGSEIAAAAITAPGQLQGRIGP